MQVKSIVKTCFLSFNPVVQLILMNFHFDCNELKICFLGSILRTNNKNYSFALETCNGDDMQCNVSLGQMGVAKWGVCNSSYQDNDMSTRYLDCQFQLEMVEMKLVQLEEGNKMV